MEILLLTMERHTFSLVHDARGKKKNKNKGRFKLRK
jgi:hypothetical protein